MEYNCEITLIGSPTKKQNKIGDTVEIPKDRKVLASTIDYRSKDYYQALTSGLKPAITFGISKYEYEKEERLRYEGNLYKIIDVFKIDPKYENEFDSIGLICQAVI